MAAPKQGGRRLVRMCFSFWGDLVCLALPPANVALVGGYLEDKFPLSGAMLVGGSVK